MRIEIFAMLGFLLVKALYGTLRWERLGSLAGGTFFKGLPPAIFVFWHSHQLGMLPLYCSQTSPRPRLYMLISRHADGRIVARIARFFGVYSVAGSSTRGGSEALYELLRHMRAGHHVAVTPDGPKGPAERVKQGVVRIAQRAGTQIYPVAYAAASKWEFKSWDRMFLPKPFSRMVGMVGEPLSVPENLREDEIESYTKELETRLSDLVMAVNSHVARA